MRFPKYLPPLTPEHLRELFSYNPENGELRVIKTQYRLRFGTVIDPYKRTLVVEHRKYTIADLCWFHFYGEWPEMIVDHKDRCHWHNNIANLRKATESQNQWNKSVDNPHGYKGVTWRNRKNPWLCKIRVHGKRINLGSYATKEEAAQVYREACLKYHGEFAQPEANDKPVYVRIAAK